MEFQRSRLLSVGMELELQLLDRNTLDLSNQIMPLMEFYPGSTNIKPEFIQNTVEVASDVFDNLHDLETHMRTLITDLSAKCEALDLLLCGAGSHPFGQRLATITPFPRYLQMERDVGFLGQNQITFATHVHVGMESGDQAVHVMRDLKPFLPLLIALSANSPYWRGYDTGFASYRHRILAAARSYGTPPTFEDWASFEAFFEQTVAAGIFETINDIHWDIRPRPKLGTVEVRVMDAQPTVARGIALAGFIRTLVNYLVHTDPEQRPQTLPQPERWWIQKDNSYQASWRGLSAKYVFNSHRRISTLRDVLFDVLDTVHDSAKELHQTRYLKRLRGFALEGAPHLFQRKVYEATASMKEVVRELVDTLKQDVQGTADTAADTASRAAARSRSARR